MAKKKSEIEITKSMTFAEILKKHPEIAKMLAEKGMHCIGCPMAAQESIEQGAIVHGINPEELVKEVNKKLKSKEKTK